MQRQNSRKSWTTQGIRKLGAKVYFALCYNMQFCYCSLCYCTSTLNHACNLAHVHLGEDHLNNIRTFRSRAGAPLTQKINVKTYFNGNLLRNALRPYLIDFMFRGSGGSDFCSLQKKKKKWARSCACVRAPNCVVVTQLCSRKKINDIHGDFNDIHAFFYPPPGSQFSLGNP